MGHKIVISTEQTNAVSFLARLRAKGREVKDRMIKGLLVPRTQYYDSDIDIDWKGLRDDKLNLRSDIRNIGNDCSKFIKR